MSALSAVGPSHRKALRHVTVVMPALNEAEAVGPTIREVKRAFEATGLPVEIEVVVVDGKSRDSTVEVARAEGARVIIQKSTGYGDALYSAFVYSSNELRTDIICTMDADGSYDPMSLVEGVSRLMDDKFDLVMGARVIEGEAMTATNRFGNKVITWMVRRILGVEVSDSQSGMFIFWASLVENIQPKMRGWAFNTEILTRALESEYRIGEIRSRYKKRIGNRKLPVATAGLANLSAILRMTRDSRPLLFHGTISAALLVSALVLGVRTILTSSLLLAILTALLALIGLQVLIFGLVADMIKDVRTSQMKKPLPYKTTDNASER